MIRIGPDMYLKPKLDFVIPSEARDLHLAADFRSLAALGMTIEERPLRLGGEKPYWPAPQHFLYFLPLPQGQGSLRPTFSPERTTCCTCMSPAPAIRACSSSRFFLR